MNLNAGKASKKKDWIWKPWKNQEWSCEPDIRTDGLNLSGGKASDGHEKGKATGMTRQRQNEADMEGQPQVTRN